jgi:hypothetical protein
MVLLFISYHNADENIIVTAPACQSINFIFSFSFSCFRVSCIGAMTSLQSALGEINGQNNADNKRNTTGEGSGGGAKNRRSNNHRRNAGNKNGSKNVTRTTSTEYYSNSPKDENLTPIGIHDPRGEDPAHRMTKQSKGRNTESFDPLSTLVRPDVRVKVSMPTSKTVKMPLKHDDVIIVPQLFGDEDDWSMYYKLVEEMTRLQKQQVKGSEWISWHEGAHLIAKDPKGSETFNEVIDKLCDYFQIQKTSIGTRFNWYKDSSDWKPFHHDSA